MSQQRFNSPANTVRPLPSRGMRWQRNIAVPYRPVRGNQHSPKIWDRREQLGPDRTAVALACVDLNPVLARLVGRMERHPSRDQDRRRCWRLIPYWVI
jgi:hypothetical protein